MKDFTFPSKREDPNEMKANKFYLPSLLNLIDIPGGDSIKAIALESYKEENPEITEISEADLFGTTLPDVKYKGTLIKSIRLMYTKKVKYITLVRYLTGKISYNPVKIERIDILLLYDSLLVLQVLAEKDEKFKSKFGSDLESLAKILKSFKLHPKTKILDVKKLGDQMKERIPNFILPERNLSTVWIHVQKMYFFSHSTSSGRDIKRLPPKQYIGKGYTDKGTARNPAIDGSQPWQEIGQTLAYDPEESIYEKPRE